MDFESFLNEFIEEDGLYKPKDPSFNHYRHYGQRKNNSILFEYKEVLYMFDKEIKPKDLDLKIYFELKNNGYNVLLKDDIPMIYNKTKHFNRDKDSPLATLCTIHKDSDVLTQFSKLKTIGKTVFSIKGNDDFCLVESECLEFLNKETDVKMKKLNPADH